jgi:circadian clock protein KaiB
MSENPIFRFRLYVTDGALNGQQAIFNLNAICLAYLPNRHHIEIVDVIKQPDMALADRIFMAPTLVKLGPLPERRIIGTLSETGTVLSALGLQPREQVNLAPTAGLK